MKKILVIALGLIIVLTACGNKAEKNSDKEEVMFGEIMNKGTKWFYLANIENGNIDKNSEVNTIIKSDNGKIISYNVDYPTIHFSDKDLEQLPSNKTIGEISKMNDEDIEKYAKKKHKMNVERGGVGSLALYNQLEDNNKILEANFNKDKVGVNYVDGTRYNNKKSDYDKTMEYYKEAKKDSDKIYKDTTKAFDLNIKVISDSTGNNTIKEKFNIGATTNEQPNITEVGNNGKENIKKTKEMLNSNFTLNPKKNYYTFDGGSVQKIYDSNFAYMFDVNEGDVALITKVSDKTKRVKPDSPNEKYVTEDE